METTFKLKCKPYVYHYLKEFYGEPVDFSKDIIINTFLKYLLSKKYTEHEKYLNFKDYTCSIDIVINSSKCHNSGYFLNNTAILHLNRIIEETIKLQLLNQVAAINRINLNSKVLTSQKEIYKNVLSIFKLEEEHFKLESFIKMNQRIKNKLKFL